MLIAVRYFLGCQISAYHWDIVCNFLLMSIVTHLSSLAVISAYFSNLILGSCRIILILIVFAFSGVIFSERNNSHFPTGVPDYSPRNETAPPTFLHHAACFTSSVTVANQVPKAFNDAFKRPERITGLAEYSILFVFTIISLLMAIAHSFVTSPARLANKHLHMRRASCVLRIGLLLAAIGIAIAACVQFNRLRKWMHASVWPADNNESEWTFGQLVPVFLMLLAPLQFIEAFAGE